MFCRKCGSQIPDDAIFCGQCGFKDVPMEAEQKQAPEAPVSPVAEQPVSKPVEPIPETRAEAEQHVSKPVEPIPEPKAKAEKTISAPSEPMLNVNPEVIPELYERPVNQMPKQEQPVAPPVQQMNQQNPGFYQNPVLAQQQQQTAHIQTPVRQMPVNRKKSVFETLPDKKFDNPEFGAADSPAAKKGPGVAGMLVSVLLAIVIFVIAFAETAILTVRQSIGEESVKQFISDVDLDDYIDGEDGKRLDEVFHLPSVGRFVKTNAADYSEYLLGGNKPEGISTEDVLELIDDNLYDIAWIYGFDPDDFRFDKVEANFDENGEELLGVFSSEVRTNDGLELVRNLLSVVTLVILAILLIGAVVLLIRMQKNFKGVCMCFGIPLIAASIPFIGFTLLNDKIVDAVKDALTSLASDKFVRSISSGVVSDLVEHISGYFMINGAIVLACGAVLTALGIIWGKIRKR